MIYKYWNNNNVYEDVISSDKQWLIILFKVRIAVHSCGINFADILMCLGKYQDKPNLPFIPGMFYNCRINELLWMPLLLKNILFFHFTPGVTKIKFLVTALIKYQAVKYWEQQNISIRRLSFDLIPHSQNKM